MNNDQLMHYASKYYDPVKAHEYYLKNRELKGRRSTGSLDDEGKEKWAYTKNQITTEKKSKLDDAKDEQNKKIEELRNKASATRANISEKLKALNEKLSEQASDKKEQIINTKNNSVKQLQNYLKSNSLSYDAKLRIREKISKLQEDAKSDTASVTEDTKLEKSKNSENARQQREQVSVKLKSAISAARQAYKSSRENINSSYEDIYNREYDKILSEHKKASKKSGDSSSKREAFIKENLANRAKANKN